MVLFFSYDNHPAYPEGAGDDKEQGQSDCDNAGSEAAIECRAGEPGGKAENKGQQGHFGCEDPSAELVGNNPLEQICAEYPLNRAAHVTQHYKGCGDEDALRLAEQQVAN